MTDTAKATPAEIAETMINVLMGRDAADAQEQSRALLAAATTVLQDRFGTNAALEALGNFADAVRFRAEAAPSAPVPIAPAPATAPALVLPPDQLAVALVDQLRDMPRWEAHERARAVVAGAGAYLHATFGASYASAVTDGALQAATTYGVEHRGGRDTLDTLH